MKGGIVVNLALNARDAVAAVTVPPREAGKKWTPTIEFRTGLVSAGKKDGGRSRGTHARLSVIDNGVGMNEETRTHAFEPFFSTKGQKGTGLGLSITYGLVKKLGGDISVESEVGKGTSFTVTLPVKRLEAPIEGIASR